MSDELENRLKDIQERLEKATPGPWHQDETFPECIMAGESDVACAHEERLDSGPVHPPDADFIAHSRSDIEFLLSALRTAQPLTRAIEQIREILKGDYEASYDLINDISALLDSLADQ